MSFHIFMEKSTYFPSSFDQKSFFDFRNPSLIFRLTVLGLKDIKYQPTPDWAQSRYYKSFWIIINLLEKLHFTFLNFTQLSYVLRITLFRPVFFNFRRVWAPQWNLPLILYFIMEYIDMSNHTFKFHILTIPGFTFWGLITYG